MPKPPCHLCGKPALFITANGEDICRWCHPPHDEVTRTALNNLREAGLI